MEHLATEHLYARNIISLKKHQKSSLKNNLARYTNYKDTTPGSGRPQVAERQSWESVSAIIILYLTSQAAFLNYAGVCSTQDGHSYLTRATHNSQSDDGLHIYKMAW